MRPTAWEFRNKIAGILNTARQYGKSYVDVESGKLHGDLAGDPKSNHRMPICCDVMKRMMRKGDFILNESTSGHGASLTIRYAVYDHPFGK
jgi:5-methylcytosine-specific restriction protein A